MNIDPVRLRSYTPFLVPIVLVSLGWVALVRPTMARTARSTQELETLRQRMTTIRADVSSAPPLDEPLGDPLAAFQRRVSATDPGGRVMEELSRLASAAGIQILTIEPADEETASFERGPAVADRPIPDPRLALFEAPLRFSPITLTADCDYRSLGEFLWRLRDLGPLIEIRNLEVTPLAASDDETLPPPGRLRVTVTTFAYSVSSEGRRESTE